MNNVHHTVFLIIVVTFVACLVHGDIVNRGYSKESACEQKGLASKRT